MLLTMPELKWNVRVDRWLWVYAFNLQGGVSWRDPFNGKSGRGSWRHSGDTIVTRWNGSKTWEEWYMPANPDDARGVCHMDDEDYELKAHALNYHLAPGDVVVAGEKLIRTNGFRACVIYPDHVKSGGTIAWVCNNPGNIREGAKYGAYAGKHLTVPGLGNYAIFPDENTGLMAVVSVLRGYGRVTLLQAMHKYAGKGDGQNDPDGYARTLAGGMRIGIDTPLPSLSDEQLLRIATLITGVEGTVEGSTWARDDPRLPPGLAGRLTRT